jgi:ADP-ribosylglycohydrolase
MWRRRLDRDQFFYCMRNAYDLIRNGTDPRIAGHWNLVTGTAVMCMEPVGVYHLCDQRNAYIDAKAIAYMYQRGVDVEAAAILAAGVAAAFRPNASVDTVLQAAIDAAPTERATTFDTRRIDNARDFLTLCIDVASRYTGVFEAREELYAKCLCYDMIDPLEVLGLSFAIVKIADGDVRTAAVGGTNIGRDSDTIAGRCAMLCGTLRGAGNIPQEWVDLFDPEILKRIRRTAERLTVLIREEKLPCMRSRQDLLQ